MRAWLVLGALAVLAALVVLFGRPGGERVVVGPGPIEKVVVARAIVEPAAGVTTVASGHAGTVDKLAVEVGERVERGQLLAVIEADGGRVEVPAPRAGTILRVRVAPGDGVPPYAPLVELADLKNLEARIEIDAREAGAVTGAAPVRLRPLGGGDVRAEGRIERLSPAVAVRRIGAMDARVRAEGKVITAWMALGPNHELRTGEELEAVIALPPQEVAARVPHAAIAVVDGTASVRVPFMLLSATTPVELGISDEHHVEVKGVRTGTTVLIP